MGKLLLISGVIACVLIVIWAWRVLNWLWWKPKKLERSLREQGINGLPYKLFYGNLKEETRLMKEAQSKPIINLSHDIVSRVSPFIHQNINTYAGKMFFMWIGTTPRVNIMDPDLIKDIMSNKFGHFGKPKSNPLIKLLATGVALYENEKWAKHRRIINPAFHLEKLKLMVPAFHTSSSELVNRWGKLITSEGSCELDVWPEFRNLAGDAISRTAFGSSYEEGRQIFQLQNEQTKLVMEISRSIYVPGFRFIPTKRNNRMKEIEREVHALLTAMINKRENAIKLGEANNDDLLGLLIESNNNEIKEHGNKKNVGMSTDEVIEECKLFYFAGQETTAVLLTWTMLMLGMHQDWQARAREEVFQAFGNSEPNIDGLNHLKIVTMIFYEVLRLYPPGIALTRWTFKQMKLGEISLPPGVQLFLPILLIHHDRELWGEDANEFKPERFAEGVSKATKNQVSFFPFGWGPRICIGQNFAMIEAKIALAMILQHFSFDLSPSYAHAPCNSITLQPQYGAQIILHKL